MGRILICFPSTPTWSRAELLASPSCPSLTLLPLTLLPLNLSQELGKEDVAYIDTTLKLALLMHKQVRLRGSTQSVH